MAQAFVSIGSNIDRHQQISQCVYRLNKHFKALLISPTYESESVGFSGFPFYNLVISFDTDLGLMELYQQLRKIEDDCGRQRGGEKFSNRTLDIDLILYDDVIYQQQKLTIPRQDILDYAFVLCPLADIVPSLKHPVNGKSYTDLWNQFDQPSQPLEKIDIIWDTKDAK
jgi:2-amino-4-hydroxy-6-hydroxymethyldihydropteridine diphosphokinase